VIRPQQLLFAFVLDLAIGDPRWLPPPVVITGRAIDRVEGFLRKYFGTPRKERVSGVLRVLLIVLLVLAGTAFVRWTLGRVHGHVMFGVIAAFFLYVKELSKLCKGS